MPKKSIRTGERAETQMSREELLFHIWQWHLPLTQGTLTPTLASNSEDPGVFYVLSNKGCYRSADAGESWESLPLPWKSEYEHQQQQALVISNV